MADGMLVLSRKREEEVVITTTQGTITVFVVRVHGNRVKLGFRADRAIKILRANAKRLEMANASDHDGPAPTIITVNGTQRHMKSHVAKMIKIATGEANRERPHVVVPLYMPLSSEIPHEEASRFVSPEVRASLAKGNCCLVAVGGGTMNEPGSPARATQLVLLYGKLDEEDQPMYLVFDSVQGGFDEAVMMDGDGTRCFPKKPLPQKEALIKWMAGFLNWNCDVPGLYQFSYALVQQPSRGGGVETNDLTQ